jgi:probable HAF family extracellular repeat protein
MRLKSYRRTGITITIFIMAYLFATHSAIAQQQYTITDLGKLGGRASACYEIDKDGRVTGWSETNQLNPSGVAIKKPFIWHHGTMSEIPSLVNGKAETAVAIATVTSSIVFPVYYLTGDAETSTGSTHAFFYDSTFFSGGTRDIGLLPNTTESHGLDVNTSGQVAGWAASANGPLAFLYSQSSGITDISLGSPSAAYGINNKGQVVGYYFNGSYDRAFIYTISTGQRQDIKAVPGYPYSYAFSISEKGTYIVGYVADRSFTTGQYRAFIYDQASGLRIIGTVKGYARAVNNEGHAVGTFKNSSGEDRAFIFQNGQMTDLNSLIPSGTGWVITAAKGINDAGQIVGYGTIGGEQHALLMTPIPSPYRIFAVPLTASTTQGAILRINNSGQAVGQSSAGHAAIWKQGQSSPTDLGTLSGGTTSQAYGVNDFGEVAGESENAQGAFHAVHWYGSNNTLVDLTPSGEIGRAKGVNILGHVVGTSTFSGSYYEHAFYRDGSALHDIHIFPNLSSLSRSEATNINELDQVVGYSADPYNGYQAFVWSANSGMTSLPYLVGNTSIAWDNNNVGQVVGFSGDINWLGHACRWTKDNQGLWRASDLGSLSGFSTPSLSDYSEAFSINNLGQVVGSSNAPSNGSPRAFIWYNGRMVDLNQLIPQNSGWVLTSANDINDFGQIVGIGFLNGQLSVFLLTR